MRYSPWWAWVPAKSDRHGLSRQRGGPLWNTLLAHALDVAAVCGELFDHYLAQRPRQDLADAYGGGCLATARKILMLLTALHDLGKATPGWMRRFLTAPDTDPELQQALAQWATHARQAGFLTADNCRSAPSAPHQHVTARYLPALLGCPGCTPDVPGTCHTGLHHVATLLGGHHGHIPSDYELSHADVALTPDWRALHEDLLQELAHHLRVDLAALPTVINPQRPIALIHLAGLTVLCDWVASDESRFSYRAGGTPTQWWANARQDATHAIRDLGLQRWLPTDDTWAKVHPDTPNPNALQQAVIDVTPLTGPTLALIESTTGSGKTELALWLAHHLAIQNGHHGFYLAQATRMATEQLATRCATFLGNTASGRLDANLAIVTGTASTSATAQELQANKASLTDLARTVNLTDDDCSPVVLDTWFLHTGRGLLSPFGIGTVDQVVLAAQKFRHWFLRLFGLAQKVVIIDEAHAYEMYQQRLLGTAIAWFAEAGTSVIILSATLPATIRTDLIDAWCTGHRTTPPTLADTGPITLVDHNGHLTHTKPATTPTPLRTTLHLRNHPGPQALAQEILFNDHAVNGAILNDRESATSLYHALANHPNPPADWSAKDDLILIHSLFTERDRGKIQQRILKALGPHPDPHKRRTHPNPNRPRLPQRLIVVGTQVLEQSLDIDFDMLYSDLAPIDLLIQRRGRLWRHLINRLQLADAASDLHVLWRPGLDGLPRVLDARQRPTSVYAPYVQAATWHALHSRAGHNGLLAISTQPSRSDFTIAPLIHEVYSQSPPTGPDPIHALLATTYDRWQADLAAQEAEALKRAVAPYPYGLPTEIEDLASGASHGACEDSDDSHHLVARSRLGEPSINVVALYQQPNGHHTWDPDGHLAADLTRYHPYRQPDEHRAQQREVMLNTIPLPHSWFRGKYPLPPHAAWTAPQVPALARRPVLLLTPNGHSLTNGVQLKYSPTTGLSRT
ncbi:CRISPR-associated helicase Cas3' [Streptomyces noursei]|uniref:CRISPR-associated helicase Cas3' n=1 Tax=Streptomyces noursei TaxID=1971 RepID=UPI0037F41EBE